MYTILLCQYGISEAIQISQCPSTSSSFLLINLLALIHRNEALPARLPSPSRAPRTSCVIPEPRLPELHSCLPTDPDSIRLPPSVLTAPFGLSYSAVIPKGAFSIRDTPQPPTSCLHPWFQLAPCSSSVAQCPRTWTTQLCSDWDCSTRPGVLRRCPQGCFFHPRHISTSKPSCLYPWFQLAPCSSSLAQYQSTG